MKVLSTTLFFILSLNLETMNEIIQKLSSYNIFNYLFPWVLFVTILDKYLGYNLTQENFIIWAFLYYFIWLVISRIWSLVIEPLFIKLKIVNYSDYKDYVIAEKKDEKIKELLEISNTYRTLISLFFSILFILIYNNLILIYIPLNNYSNILLILFFILLFTISFKKQVSYIKKRVDTFK